MEEARERVKGITYETYFKFLKQRRPDLDDAYKKWVEYLGVRYGG